MSAPGPQLQLGRPLMASRKMATRYSSDSSEQFPTSASSADSIGSDSWESPRTEKEGQAQMSRKKIHTIRVYPKMWAPIAGIQKTRKTMGRKEPGPHNSGKK